MDEINPVERGSLGDAHAKKYRENGSYERKFLFFLNIYQTYANDNN